MSNTRLQRAALSRVVDSSDLSHLKVGTMYKQLIKFFNITGLTWFVPLVKIAAGENPVLQIRQLFLIMGVPIIAFAVFLVLPNSYNKCNTL